MKLILTLILTLVGLAATAVAQTPELGTILTPSGTLVRLYGPASAPHLEAKPPLTHYLQFIQSDASDAWIAATSDSVIYHSHALRSRLSVSHLSALSISPSGRYIAVAADHTITVYVTTFGMLNHHKTIHLATQSAPPAGDPSLMAVTDYGNLCLTFADKTYIVGMDNVLVPSPKRLTFLHAGPRGYFGFDADAKAIVLTTFNVFNHRLTIETLASEGITEPTGLAVNATGTTLWLSQKGGEHSLLRVSTATREVHGYDLTPAGAIRPTSQPNVYFWTDTALLDTTSEPAIIPIPPPPAAEPTKKPL